MCRYYVCRLTKNQFRWIIVPHCQKMFLPVDATDTKCFFGQKIWLVHSGTNLSKSMRVKCLFSNFAHLRKIFKPIFVSLNLHKFEPRLFHKYFCMYNDLVNYQVFYLSCAIDFFTENCTIGNICLI
jgi:hypothetical protein